ncbi:MAG: hypothetical protein WC068_14790 [Caulobacter sp.]
MGRSERKSQPNTLGLAGDGDDIDLILTIEGSFGVHFGDETAKWWTVGDIHQALLDRVPVAATPGLCSTSMAFYRIRAVLAEFSRSPSPVRPSTRLSEFRIAPKALSARLMRELGIRQPAFPLFWWGVIGCVALLLGIASPLLILAVRAAWPALLLIPAGLIMVWTDRGQYGRMTVGDLAQKVAIRNFAYFTSQGADSRPETLWRALRQLLVEETDINPSHLTADTRLVA